jgi:hypothetical protein
VLDEQKFIPFVPFLWIEQRRQLVGRFIGPPRLVVIFVVLDKPRFARWRNIVGWLRQHRPLLQLALVR